MESNLIRIENTPEARKAPPNQYRLLLAGHDDERTLFHVQDFDRAELAIRAARELRLSKEIQGWGIVHDGNGRVIEPAYENPLMLTYQQLSETYVGRRFIGNNRTFDVKHADEIEVLQQERLPGWQKGDHMLVYWSDIAKATGAVAYCGNF